MELHHRTHVAKIGIYSCAGPKALRKRTLTNLYNARPQWLANAHATLDAAVAAAYGWPTDITKEEPDVMSVSKRQWIATWSPRRLSAPPPAAVPATARGPVPSRCPAVASGGGGFAG